MRWMLWTVALIMAATRCTLAAPQVKILADFEQQQDLRLWEYKQGTGQLSDQHATHGGKSLRVGANEYMVSWRLPRDWSGYDSLDIDLFVEGDGIVSGTLLIADEAWQQKGGTYWNRHNGSFSLKPGPNVLSIPVNGLFRGEAGSRNNDIKSNIDPSKIIRMDLGFKGNGTLYIDQMRLVKESRPDGILAFDFGPASQAVFPGFTPISWNTVHGRNGATAGLKGAASPGMARDDTFPTRLYQDYVAMDWNEFLVDVPPGQYHVWVVFDDCGYWGGEQAAFRRRWIDVDGKQIWEENAGQHGLADYLYRFENIEPKPGDSMWDLYVKGMFEPKRFVAEVKQSPLRLRFRADGHNACKVAAVILYPDSAKAEAQKWVAEIEERNRKEFDARAVIRTLPQKQLDPPSAAKDYWLGFPSLEQDIRFSDAPGPDGRLACAAARGQRVSLTFAIRPLKSVADTPARLEITDLVGPQGKIPANEVDLRYVHHATHRGFNDIAYTIAPETLRLVKGSALQLAKDITRQFWITIHTPPQTPPGKYVGEVRLTSGDLDVKLPLSLEVLDITLDEPDFTMGFYGTHVPDEILATQGPAAWKDLLTTIKQGGMNSFSGGPNVRFSGFTPDGKPILDFAAADEFFRIARACGFAREVMAYGGPGMITGLHDGYVIGETGRNWERKTGKPFGEILKIVWGAVRDHAQKENWLPILYGFTDEPRVIESAKAELELMRLYREAVPFVNIGGSYSVKWNDDPLEQAIQEIFKTLRWSALNAHGQIDLDKGREFNKNVYIYNQGTDRYSFGMYQWAEMRKGVKGRMQWHLLALHGYQFFDLDGREPDTAMINWGSREIIPTLRLHRCREGANDLRYAATLWNLAERKGDREAKDWLESISQQIRVGQNSRPDGLMSDEAFREECIARIKRLTRN